MIIRMTTKEIISASFIELAEVHAVKYITVKKISDNCGITTRTFYNHFQDKYELTNWIYDHQVEEFFQALQNGCTWAQCLRLCVEALLKHHSFYCNILNDVEYRTYFHYGTNNYAITLLCEYIKKKSSIQWDDEELTVYCTMYMRSVAEIIISWLRQKKPWTVERLVTLLVAGVPQPLYSYLGKLQS